MSFLNIFCEQIKDHELHLRDLGQGADVHPASIVLGVSRSARVAL